MATNEELSFVYSATLTLYFHVKQGVDVKSDQHFQEFGNLFIAQV